MNLKLLLNQAKSGEVKVTTQTLLNLLSNFRTGIELSFQEVGQERDTFDVIVQTFHALFLNKHFILSQTGFEWFCLYNDEINAIFQISSHEDSSFIVQDLLKQVRQSELKSSHNLLRKIFAIATLNSFPQSLFDILSELPKDIMFPSICGMLSTRLVLSNVAMHNKNKLLALGSLIEHSRLTPLTMSTLSASYMFSSYATLKEKHSIKVYLNAIISDYLKLKKVSEPFTRRDLKKTQPIFLVIADDFRSNHAVYRCYAPSIMQLKGKLKLYLLHGNQRVDEKAKSLFDHCIQQDFSYEDIKSIIGKIIKLKPDMIYYPSIGMSRMSVVLSNLRLAPIQLMSGGHPATTYSSKIDYCIAQQELLGEPSCFSETLVVNENALNFSLYDDNPIPTPQIKLKSELIRIAIPAHCFKLNSDFLNCCERIAKASSKEVQLCFFPNVKGVLFQACSAYLKNKFANCVVFPQSNYQDYMSYLNSCDIHFSTFPFGMTNGIVDSSLLGLPMLTLDGVEIHSHADSGMIRLLGLPNWLCAQSILEFEAAAKRLIEEDELRIALSHQTIAANAREVFLSHSVGEKTFLDTILWIYFNLEKIQKVNKKVWKQLDRVP